LTLTHKGRKSECIEIAHFTGNFSLPTIRHNSVLLIFRRSLLLRLSVHISHVPSLNLQPNPLDGTIKKLKQATKSKTNGLASSALLGLSKDGRGFADDLTEGEQDTDCSVLVVSLKTTM
jgi:hypothetical protein